MFRRLTAISPSEFRKWCGFALMLLVPGSFVAFAVLWIVRQLGVQALRQGR
jgi:hypothetical protein